MELRAGPEARGVRLDAFLAGPLGSRSRAQRLIEAGAVTVDGAPAPKRLRLTGGEAIAVDEAQVRAPDAAAAETAPFRVAYEDEHLLVVDKPAGVVVHPARGHAHGTLSQALAGRAGGGAPERAGIVHRLDRDTSGLLGRRAHGAGPPRAARPDGPARDHARVPRARGGPAHRRGPARSTRRSGATGAGARATPPTRTSRARRSRTSPRACPARDRHCCGSGLETGPHAPDPRPPEAIGHPVCGDPEYGTAGSPGLRRQFLHAARLAFAHPATAGGGRLLAAPCRPARGAAAGRERRGVTPRGSCGGPDHQRRGGEAGPHLVQRRSGPELAYT
jgi:23S rRNA pseudouridine1911/1915/1917 synthase